MKKITKTTFTKIWIYSFWILGVLLVYTYSNIETLLGVILINIGERYKLQMLGKIVLDHIGVPNHEKQH